MIIIIIKTIIIIIIIIIIIKTGDSRYIYQRKLQSFS